MGALSKEVKKKYASGERYSDSAILKKREANCEKWIAKSIIKYHEKFDYSNAKLQYETQKKPEVEILCKEHEHKFFTTPDKHIQYKFGGCEHCEREAVQAQFLKKSLKSFQEWFERERSHRLEIVGDFAGMTERLDFYCKIHKTIEDYLPTAMMNGPGYGWGCSACAKDSISKSHRLDTKSLVEILTPQLPSTVAIKKIYFDNDLGSTFIITECIEHGQQLPMSRSTFESSPTKCQNCSLLLNGYGSNRLKTLIGQKSKGRPSKLAVMEMKVFDIKGLKVGFTTKTLEHRYRDFLQTVYFEVNLFEIDALVLENRIKVAFHKEKDERVLKAGVRQGKRWSGDTEFFWFTKKDEIINYIRTFLQDIHIHTIDYEKELGKMIIPSSLPRRSEFKAGKFQTKIPIVGIDEKTNEILYELDSYTEAEKLGFDNIALIVSEKYGRSRSKGVRWFKKSEFDPDNIPILEIPGAKAVFCVERNQHFRSPTLAEETLRPLGINLSASKITSVITGRRKKAAGMTWEYSTLNSKEILNQNIDSIIDFRPPRASNAKISVRLVSEKDSDSFRDFDSMSTAAEAIGSSPGNLRRAIKKGHKCKGYFVIAI